jgi:hypothetical protein
MHVCTQHKQQHTYAFASFLRQSRRAAHTCKNISSRHYCTAHRHTIPSSPPYGLHCQHTPAAQHAAPAAPDAAPAAASLVLTPRKPAHALACHWLLRAAAQQLQLHRLAAKDLAVAQAMYCYCCCCYCCYSWKKKNDLAGCCVVVVLLLVATAAAPPAGVSAAAGCLGVLLLRGC